MNGPHHASGPAGSSATGVESSRRRRGIAAALVVLAALALSGCSDARGKDGEGAHTGKRVVDQLTVDGKVSIEHVDFCSWVHEAALTVKSERGQLNATERYSYSWDPEVVIYDRTDDAATFEGATFGTQSMDCSIWVYSGRQNDTFPRFEARLVLAPERELSIPDPEKDGEDYAAEHTFEYGDYRGTQNGYSIHVALGSGLFLEMEEDSYGGSWGDAPDYLANRRSLQEPVLKEMLNILSGGEVPIRS